MRFYNILYRLNIYFPTYFSVCMVKNSEPDNRIASLSGSHHKAALGQYSGDSSVSEGSQGPAGAHPTFWYHLPSGSGRSVGVRLNGSHVCCSTGGFTQHSGGFCLPKSKLACFKWNVYMSQGFSVSLFYCFLNSEVRNALRHHISTWRDTRTIQLNQNRR